MIFPSSSRLAILSIGASLKLSRQLNCVMKSPVIWAPVSGSLMQPRYPVLLRDMTDSMATEREVALNVWLATSKWSMVVLSEVPNVSVVSSQDANVMANKAKVAINLIFIEYELFTDNFVVEFCVSVAIVFLAGIAQYGQLLGFGVLLFFRKESDI